MSIKTEKALLAGGCFWGMQDLLRKVPGILSSQVVYTGGTLENPTYNDVKKGTTGHAEAIFLEFNPEQVSYKTILDFFFRIHDPSTLNRQGNDIGSQYRSAIFYFDSNQKQIAEEQLKESEKLWQKTIVTEISPAQKFYEAEDFHQDYLEKHPNGYTCHYIRLF